MNNNNCCKIIFLIIGLLTIFIIIQIFIMINNEPTEQKNILSTVYQNPNTTLIGDTVITFDENEIQIGNAITHTEGSNIININQDGVYQISYQLYGTRDTVGIFNFNAIILVNNQPIELTLNEGPILQNSFINRMTLTGIAFLELNAGDEIKLGGVSVEAIRYTRARIDIEKIS